MIGMGMVEADDVFFAGASFALNVNQFFWINVVPVLRGVGAGIAASGHGRYSANFAIHLAEEHSAALVRIGFLAVLS